MNLQPTSDGRYRWTNTLETGQEVAITARDVRREHTGLHAKIGLGFDGNILAHDTFNIGRNEDRGRLVKSAFSRLKRLGKLAVITYDETDFKADLDIFCLTLEDEFDNRYAGDMLLPERNTGNHYALKPWLVDGGGTIAFGPPKAGKSYLSLVICQCIMYGISKFWPVQQQVVCYVNLERSERSMKHRLALVNEVLGLGYDKGIPMVNARGQSLDRVMQSVRTTVTRHKATIIAIDSISRAGVGSLVKDDTANRLIDMASSLSQTWWAIGHTPRDNGTHVFGSTMFEAGYDVGVAVMSERRGNTIGLMLQMTGANDIPMAKPAYYALEFTEAPDGEDSWLSGFRGSREGEFPQLQASRIKSQIQNIKDYLTNIGAATVSDIAKFTGIKVEDAVKLLNTHDFQLSGRQGGNPMYKISESAYVDS